MRRPAGRWRARGPLWVLGLGLFLLGGLGAEPRHAPVSKEYELKAAFLYNFTKFVEWPSPRFPDTTAPIVLGVLGSSPFGDALEKIVRDRKVNGRGIAIRYFDSVRDAHAAHVVFIGAGEEKLLGPQLEPLLRGGVLVVGESRELAARGAIVTFTMAEDKVRFEIDLLAAERAGLKISSQLLKLATHVRRTP
jgi:hypothetical protein